MGVTQYVGARYVPIFADPAEWNNTRTYEPLTIVLHEGNSFTSKQFVPVGADINDTRYWAKTGNYSAQVEAYRKEVQDLQKNVNDKIDGIEGIVDGLGTAAYKDYTETLNSSSDLITSKAVNSAIAELNNKISAKNKRFALYIGNSFTLGTGSSTGRNGIYERTKDLFDDSLMKYSDGTGFDQYTGHGASNTFDALLSQFANDPSVDNNAITDIIFISAMGDTRAICEGKNMSGLKNTIDNAHSKFPNASVYIYYAEITGKKDVQKQYSEYYPIAQLRVHELFEFYANKYRYTYLGWGGWEINFDDQYCFTDHYHPNDNGYTILSSAFKNAFNGNYKYPLKNVVANYNSLKALKITMNSPLNGFMRISDIAKADPALSNGLTQGQDIDYAIIWDGSAEDNNPVCSPPMNTNYGVNCSVDNASNAALAGYFHFVKKDTNKIVLQFRPARSYTQEEIKNGSLFGSALWLPITMFIDNTLTMVQ